MIYFVRHGQTKLNKQKIFQGHIDEPLDDLGALQAINVALELKDEKFDYLFCSPLKRARQTAEAINKYHNLKIVEDKRLAETNLGRMQGQPYSPDNIDKYFADPKNTKAKDLKTFILGLESF